MTSPGAVVLRAAICAAAQVLGVSASAHALVLSRWVPETVAAAHLDGVGALGTGLGLLFGVRRRLSAVARAGLFAVVRPRQLATSPAAREAALGLLAVALSLGAGRVFTPWVAGLSASPSLVGLGLLGTAALLGVVGLAGAPRATTTSPLRAVCAGVAHGASVGPGAAPSASALAVLAWLGVAPTDAVELVCGLGGVILALSGVAELGEGAAGVDLGAALLALMSAFLTAAVCVPWLRALAGRRRLWVVAAYVASLGLATLAYARAL